MSCENNDEPCEDCTLELCPDQIDDAKTKHAALKETALLSIRSAEKAMFEYARNCEVGSERESAFRIYEFIRTSTLLATWHTTMRK